MRANFNANTLAYNIDWVRARLLAAQEPVVTLASAYTGYVTQGTYTSPTFDTGGVGSWKYLVWEEVKPTGTGLALRIRTAATEAALATTDWVSYPQSGTLITNPAARWIQYEADLSTTDTLITPELQKVTIYYEYDPTAVMLSTFTGMPHLSSVHLDWETGTEFDLVGFNIWRSDSEDGEREKRNDHLLPASGQTMGDKYQFIDETNPGRYYYWLELVDDSGGSIFSDSLTVITGYQILIPIVNR